MKGLVPKQSSDTIYLETKYFSICEVSRKPREGFETIKVPDVSTGEEITKYIKRYDLEGLITKLEWRDTKDQYETRFRSWRVHVDAAGTPVVLEIKWKSGPCDRLMKTVENVDLSKPVEFRAWQGRNKKTGKPQAAFALFQDGQNVPAKYKQGNMGDCPEPTEEIDGLDFGPQVRFLYNQMINVVIPKIDAMNAMRNERSPEHEQERDPFAEEDDTADF